MVSLAGPPPVKQKTRHFTQLSKSRTGLFLELTEALGNGRAMIRKSRNKRRYTLQKILRGFQKLGK